MANEIRTRFNLIEGTLSAQLTAGATSMSSAGLASLGVIDTTNFCAITIENEIVWVTAHTAAATTATIVRAREGTSDVTHASGAGWVHAPTALDFDGQTNGTGGAPVRTWARRLNANQATTGTLVDTNLKFFVAANEIWAFKFTLLVTSGDTATAFKVALTGPVGTTLVSQISGITPTAIPDSIVMSVLGSENGVITFATAVSFLIYFEGSILVSSTAGVATLQVRHNAGTAWTINAGSTLTAWRAESV
jgi:hypothetical protein